MNRQRRLLWIQTLTTKDKGILARRDSFCCRFCLQADVLWITARVLMPQEASGSNQQAHEERRRATAHPSGGREDSQWWQLQKKKNGKKMLWFPAYRRLLCLSPVGASHLICDVRALRDLQRLMGRSPQKSQRKVSNLGKTWNILIAHVHWRKKRFCTRGLVWTILHLS